MVLSLKIGRILINELEKIGIKAHIFDEWLENDKEWVIITLISGSSYQAIGLNDGCLTWCPPEGGDDEWDYTSIYDVAAIIRENENINNL
jgi:hypothetical protein